MRQGLQIAHAVDIKLAHQMIELMLNHACEESFGGDLNPLTMAIQRIDAEPAPSWNPAAKIRNAEAAFPIFDKLFIEDGDIGIYQNGHRNITAGTAAFDDSE